MLVGMFHHLAVIGALFAEGTTETGERVLVISAENPDRIPGFAEPVSKQTLERFHLESYQTDHVLQFGEPAFEQVAVGANPPDFHLRTTSGTEALDCAAFADHHHRTAYRLMDNLRQRLIDGAGDRNFDGVRGCLLSVWFGPTLSDLPPKRWDDSVIEPLLDAISACHVDHAAVAQLNAEIAERGFPQVMPPVIQTGTTADQAAGFVANALLGPLGGMRFSTGLGFEVQLSRQRDITPNDAYDLLTRIVNAHDQPQIDHLLLTAGGPDTTGYRYPSEEAIAGFLLGEAELKLYVKHLKRVTLHLWFARRIVDIPVTLGG
jgi:hypothetical protein